MGPLFLAPASIFAQPRASGLLVEELRTWDFGNLISFGVHVPNICIIVENQMKKNCTNIWKLDLYMHIDYIDTVAVRVDAPNYWVFGVLVPVIKVLRPLGHRNGGLGFRVGTIDGGDLAPAMSPRILQFQGQEVYGIYGWCRNSSIRSSLGDVFFFFLFGACSAGLPLRGCAVTGLQLKKRKTLLTISRFFPKERHLYSMRNTYPFQSQGHYTLRSSKVSISNCNSKRYMLKSMP